MLYRFLFRHSYVRAYTYGISTWQSSFDIVDYIHSGQWTTVSEKPSLEWWKDPIFKPGSIKLALGKWKGA